MSFKQWKISSTVIEPVELVGEVFDLNAVVIFFGKFGKKYRKRMHAWHQICGSLFQIFW